ncbi:AAA family ATPase [Streptomyces sp. FZ201]|uniref:ATP-binding protein n=1 Tax=Streptomyces sp. FZ201 TaxID=3057122 RepID=UPI0021BF3947|nr:AAA family ATPase [Streptomyces sp. FZ201]
MREAAVRVQALGRLRVRPVGGPEWRLGSARAESLLGYLVLHRGTAHSRQHLAGVLWPESGEAQARTNLRHLLHGLRHTVPEVEQVLELTPRTVAWRAGAGCLLDVEEFERGLERAGTTARVDRAAALADAVALYTGDLLVDCGDPWPVAERERLRGRFTDALEELGGLLHAADDQRGAADVLERLVREDPVRESAYRVLMRAYDALGDRARAVRAYHACVSALERELGVAPSAPTRAAYAGLLAVEGPDPPRHGGSPRLVGRQAERQRLSEAWRTAAAGRPVLVLLTGEPGIGKTRLAEDFVAWADRRHAVTAVARAHAAEGGLAYAPVVAWLRAPALRPALDRLETAFREELARLLPELGAHEPPETLPADEQRQRLFGSVARALEAAGRPVVLLADDLHRFDRESLRLLHFLARAEPPFPLLVVGTARPEETDRGHPLHEVLGGLGALGRAEVLELGPLSREETAALARGIAGEGVDADRLHTEAEGNPLFLIEALRAGRLSPRVQAVIEARLAQLSPKAGELLGVAATVGREFTADVLGAAAEVDEAALVAGLDELWRRRIIREQGLDAYDFAHEKIREVAYASVSPALRRHHHRRVADVLSRPREATPDEVCGQIADHYQRAGDTATAVPWALRAADAACRLHANAEAVALLDRMLRLLRERPASAERDRLELELLTALPAPLGQVEGYSGPRMSAAHTRALELAARLGAEPAPPLVRSLAVAATVASDFAATERYGGQLLSQGRESGDDVLVVEGSYVLGIAAFWQARFDHAREHFARAIRCYRPRQRAVHLLRYAQDPRVVCQSRLANTLWFMGRPQAAERARDAALAYAEETGHQYSRAVCLIFASVLALDMRDDRALRAHLRALTELDDPAPHVRLPAEAFSGYRDVLDGRTAQGVRRCRQAIVRMGGVQHAPGMSAVLHRILMGAAERAGDAERARWAAERLLTMGGAAVVWRPEALRVRERLDAAEGDPAAPRPERLRNAPGTVTRQGSDP